MGGWVVGVAWGGCKERKQGGQRGSRDGGQAAWQVGSSESLPHPPTIITTTISASPAPSSPQTATCPAHLGLQQQRPSDGQPLLLAAAESMSALPHLCVIPLWQLLHKLIGMGCPRRR